MIDIVVPVLGRAHQIETLLQSIEAATTETPYQVIFVCSPRDAEALDACKQSDADTIVTTWEPERADFAKKINLAYGLLDEEWLFQGATDLLFHPGWAERVLHTAERDRVGVVGTNDLGNPIVKRGQHSTHTLFSRSYIDDYGGTFDKSGVVFSEEYSHEFCDTEFIQTALLRRQFRPCLKAVVEHLHPHWNRGEMDSTYEKATKEFREDAVIYNTRMRQAKKLHARELTLRARARPRVR